MSPDEVVAGVRAGDRRALGRAISLAEAAGDAGRRVVSELASDAGRALIVGLTGAPGVGKSTLAAALVTHLRAQGQRVAVVSVDPTSPFTNGAILGDRIRLSEHFLDPDVFIRSMGARGHAGGLAEATSDAVLLLDAAGHDVVVIETVGVGQGEVEVATLAETVILALMPGSGDSIQAIKAGLMEIPDVIALTKADQPGAERLRGDLRTAFGLVPADGWSVPVVPVKALEGEGIAALWDEVGAHRAFLAESGGLEERRREALSRRLRALALARLGRRLDVAAQRPGLDAAREAVLRHELDPAGAVDRLLAEAGLGQPPA